MLYVEHIVDFNLPGQERTHNAVNVITSHVFLVKMEEKFGKMFSGETEENNKINEIKNFIKGEISGNQNNNQTKTMLEAALNELNTMGNAKSENLKVSLRHTICLLWTATENIKNKSQTFNNNGNLKENDRVTQAKYRLLKKLASFKRGYNHDSYDSPIKLDNAWVDIPTCDDSKIIQLIYEIAPLIDIKYKVKDLSKNTVNEAALHFFRVYYKFLFRQYNKVYYKFLFRKDTKMQISIDTAKFYVKKKLPFDFYCDFEKEKTLWKDQSMTQENLKKHIDQCIDSLNADIVLQDYNNKNSLR